MKPNLWLSVIFVLVLIGCGPAIFRAKWTKEIAPPLFLARFETSKGNFEVEVERRWSPNAADRFFQLVRHRYFDEAFFYRVIPDFVAQFGSGDTTLSKGWSRIAIPDEKVLLGNAKGTLSFARSGRETRSTELYINLMDNHRLDTLDYNGVVGFPAFGKVTKGMDVVQELYSGYAGRSAAKLDLLYRNRADYFEVFPKLDTIRKAYILGKP